MIVQSLPILLDWFFPSKGVIERATKNPMEAMADKKPPLEKKKQNKNNFNFHLSTP